MNQSRPRRGARIGLHPLPAREPHCEDPPVTGEAVQGRVRRLPDHGVVDEVDARAAGVGILLISGELDEVLGMSDRIGVMFEGRLVALLERSDCTAERLGLLMAGETETDRRQGGQELGA